MEQPELKRTRIILWYRDSRRGQLVSAASPLARRAGVRIGMPLSEAESLVKKEKGAEDMNGTATVAGPVNSNAGPTELSECHSEPPRVPRPVLDGVSNQPSQETFRLVGGHPRHQARVTARTLGNLPAEPLKTENRKLETVCSVGPAAGVSSNQPAASALPLTTARSTAFPSLKTENRKLKTLSPHNFELDRKTLTQLATSCHALAPITGLENAEKPNCIFLDVTHLDRLYGSEEHLLHQVVKHFSQAGYLVRAAVADTISVAWGLAQYATEDHSIAFPNDGVHALAELPVEALRLEGATCETLRQLGIETIDQLLELPRASLTARFGDEINLRLEQAEGTVREVFQAIHEPVVYRAEKLLEWPIKDTATTMVIIQRLVEQLCKELKSEALGALRWRIRLARQQSTPLELDIKLFQPTTTAAHVMQLVEMQLDSHDEFRQKSSRQKKHFARQSPVTEVAVHVTSHVQLAERQRKLFDEDPSLNRVALAQLINRLSSRLGQQQVTRPVLQSGAQPEFSFRFKPLVEPVRRRKSEAKKPFAHYVMARPLRLFRPAISLAPCPASKTLPTAFQVDGHEIIRVRRSWGPERIETGWWRGKTVCRDYWRIETEPGAQLWIYRDRRSGKWFLHGEF